MVFSKISAFLGDNAVQVDPAEYEQTLRSSTPSLLQPDESIIFAFQDRGGKGRDSSTFTSKRIIIVDKKGLTGKRVKYSTIPYGAIKAFSVETAGSADGDQELKVYARGYGKVSIDLVKGVDVMAIKKFLGEVVIGGKEGEAGLRRGDVDHNGNVNVATGDDNTGFLDLLGSNYSQIDKQAVETRLKSNPNILLEVEKVELAFQCGRDSFILTTKRILKIDVQGVSGKKIEYLTILWSVIKGFSIETAGNIIDRDSELTLYFNLPDVENHTEGFPRNSRTRMKIDFRDGKADLFAVQRFISDKLLGADSVPSSQYADGVIGRDDSGSNSLLAYLGDDNRLIDASEANRQFHSNPPILQTSETVEMAFRGRRDMILFTGKRVIFVDMQGFLGMGKKVEYISVPWSTITAFSVRSAGSWADKDSEMCLWLDFDDVYNPRREAEEDPPPPPIPRRSWLEIDFQKDKVDVLTVHRYLSERCMRVNGHSLKPYDIPVSPELLNPSPPGTGESLANWMGDNAAAIDADEVDEKFRECGILQEEEHVAFAFQTGRDSLYLTNKRLFLIDVQGFSGKRKEYMSVPWDSIRSWAVESAGSFDADMELRLWFKGFWESYVKQDLRKGKADIVAIQNFIAHFIIGDDDGETSLNFAQNASNSGSMNKFLAFISDNAVLKDPATITDTLRTSPPILQKDEVIEAAYKCGRDLFLISTKRLIIIDKKGMSGKSIEYKSVPLMYSRAFRIGTEGHMLSGSDVKVYTDDDNIEQDFAKGSGDVWSVHEILSNKLLNEQHPEIGEGEVAPYQPLISTAPTPTPVVTGSLYVPPPQLSSTFQVQNPGVVPGTQVQVLHPQTGQTLMVTVPDGVPPGGVFNVSA